jgi:hypothetical protein
MTITVFIDEDSAYLNWVAAHPEGFVVNCRRKFDPTYLVLHRATCPTIQTHRAIDENPGGFTERGYVKLCADSIDYLRQYLMGLTGSPDPFSKQCSHCEPE